MEHDKPFKPSHPPRRDQITKTFSPYPHYMEDPRKELTRKEEDEDAPPKFKPAHNYKSRPSPSVQLNIRNLKASFPSVFKR